MDDSGFPRTPDRLLESFGTRVHRSEVFETMIGACGPLNSGGSATLLSLFSTNHIISYLRSRGDIVSNLDPVSMIFAFSL